MTFFQNYSLPSTLKLRFQCLTNLKGAKILFRGVRPAVFKGVEDGRRLPALQAATPEIAVSGVAAHSA